MRWWLALVFAAIAALTALVVTEIFVARSEARIRERVQEIAAGEALTAALELGTVEEASLRSETAALARTRRIALFVFDADGRLLSAGRARGVSVSRLPNLGELRSTALAGRRIVSTIDGGRVVTVALPLRRPVPGALVAVAPRSELEDALGIVRAEIVRAALVAVAIGALAGLAVAILITRRLRRISAAAQDIAAGRFERALDPRFPDELGLLARTIDTMRASLRDSFASLRDERERLRLLLEQLDEGVLAVDRRLVVEFANRRARELLRSELAPGAVLAEPWSGFALAGALREVFAPGATARTVRVEPVPGEVYMVALLPPPTPSRAAVVVVTDVSARERHERAEREFVTSAAHELRTPLAAIASAVEALQHGAKERAEDRDRFIDVVERQTRRLSRLAHALLTLARAQTQAEPVRLEPVEVRPLLDEVAASISPSPAAVDVCCANVRVRAHRDLLQQALENLTTNALKHAPGAQLTLRAAHDDGGQIRLEVADDGPGMSRSESRRALDRFFRAADAHGNGFGLGLAIVREVVGAMAGTVSIESAPGTGTTVSIVLAAADPSETCR